MNGTIEIENIEEDILVPNENIWHPRGTRGRQPSPEDAGWIIGDEAEEHAKQRSVTPPPQKPTHQTDIIHTQDEQTEKPPPAVAPKRRRRTAVRKNAAPKKTKPTSAPKKTKGPKI